MIGATITPTGIPASCKAAIVSRRALGTEVLGSSTRCKVGSSDVTEIFTATAWWAASSHKRSTSRVTKRFFVMIATGFRNFANTSNPLDIAIQGQGFFQIRRPSGQLAYTRAGSFHLDREGNVVTLDGEPLEPQLTIPPGAQSITIAPDGTVTYALPGQTASQNGGQIQLANFQNAAGLSAPPGNRQPIPTIAIAWLRDCWSDSSSSWSS